MHIKKIFSTLAIIIILTGCSDTNKDGEKVNFDYAPNEYIIGIEPGSGTMQAAKRAMDDYGLHQTLTTGSSAVMTQMLGDAIRKKAPIVVTGWTPHWKFAKYDLKFLNDPKESFGKPEEIHTLARKDLKKDKPNAYKLLDNFEWTVDDMQEVLIDLNDGMDIKEASRKWVNNNHDRVQKMYEGVKVSNGELINLAHATWDSELASANVLKYILEDYGFEVRMMAVEIGPLFAAIAYGSADVTPSAWLPQTHKNYMDKYGDLIDDLGSNLVNARIGFVVPAYIDIDSIEELKDF
ncbi:glycine betaine ABC transporter substrate-binding protein [Anaerococcus porci]|uniref:Glycine/betaine ABC transporter n=1 Tax=Anaerococcus porci TaxID=2652269 RepID=A0A6N7VWY4_9FIRM|nr:glycine betaine ABC transporter substrate-binding protein [Anaerococcus porci]MDY3006083.1 glycine betaine ABC transporter substrate-binding protein [Anaerococcus porci]MSS78377.1 glycine/betaine ABC transporter [Anaerococcus porci]